MVKIEILIKEGKLARINELELERYINFFNNSYKDNLGHSETNIIKFPRWSIISGYYAMHDISKLLLAEKFNLKVEYEVHATAIKAIKELIKNKLIIKLIEEGYHEFISLANDLAEAKRERAKVQYFTGTAYMEEEYKKRAREFLDKKVKPYLNKINNLLK